MGGYGSGRWHRVNTKRTVEQSFTLAVRDVLGRILCSSQGTLWLRGNSLGFSVTWQEDAPAMLTLEYVWREREELEARIPLSTTPCHFGGWRLWFHCPECNQRIGKLYLPPGSPWFGCRSCHNLSYRSSQRAHEAERMITGIGMMWRYVRRLKESQS